MPGNVFINQQNAPWYNVCMNYQLQLKPFVRKDGTKYKVLQITDIALHTKPHRPTPIAKRIKDAFAKNKPGRVYSPMSDVQIDASSEGARVYIDQLLQRDPELVRMIQEEEAKGYKVLIGLPKGGIPIQLGKDAEEFIHSKNGKRLLRGRARGKGV